MDNLEYYIDRDQQELLVLLGAAALEVTTGNGRLMELEQAQRYLDEPSADERALFTQLGSRVLHRTSLKLHGLICAGNNADIGKKVEVALDAGKLSLAGVFYGLLISVGLPAAVAAIAAAALASVLFDAVFEELCATWLAYNERNN